MRSTFNAKWLRNNKNELVGIDLKSDFCAEHEWGIDELKNILGIKDKDPLGLQSRLITLNPASHMFYFENSKTGYDYFIVDKKYNIEKLKYSKKINSELPEPLKKRYSEDMLTCWYSHGFGIAVKTKEDKANLKELVQNFQDQKVAIWLGGAGVFQNAGLVIVIADRVDEENAKRQYDEDLDRKAIKEADQIIDISSRIKASNKKYWALSPKWAPQDSNTKYPLIYWLNPIDNTDNCGWFTVEELLLWTLDSGPIKKSA